MSEEGTALRCKHCGKPIRRPRRGENPAADWVHDENGYPYCGLFAEPGQEQP